MPFMQRTAVSLSAGYWQMENAAMRNIAFALNIIAAESLRVIPRIIIHVLKG